MPQRQWPPHPPAQKRGFGPGEGGLGPGALSKGWGDSGVSLGFSVPQFLLSRENDGGSDLGELPWGPSGERMTAFTPRASWG